MNTKYFSFRKWILLKKISIASFIIIAFIIITIVFLAFFGLIDYTLEKDRQWMILQQELASTAEELRLNLALPSWNFDYAQIDNIMESTMSNQNIFGIIINIGNNTRMRVRGPDWRIITPVKEFSPEGLLVEKRDIVFSGRKIGAINLFGSTRLMEEKLRSTFMTIMSFISIFVFIIIVGLYLVIHKIVLKPLLNIEQYARSVSSGAGKDLDIKGGYFQGELDTLRSSIKSMVYAHDERFLELQNEIKRRTESEEKYRNIFERSVEGIFQSTFEGKLISANPAMAHIFGYDSPDDMIQNIRSASRDLYLNPDDRIRFINYLERRGTVEGFEAQFRKKNGELVWISLNARNVCDVDGALLYFEGTVMDITMRKHSEEEKERLEAQLRQAQKMEAVGTLAGGIAHDFNNILTVISGYGTILQMQLKADDPLHKCADQILLASEKAVNLTKSLLTFCRKQPFELKPVNLDEIIAGVEKLLRRLLTEDIALQINLSGKDKVIMGDRTQIDQILFNLASNARDAMPAGGRLSIKTKLLDLQEGFRDTIGYIEPGCYVLLSIADTGKGMDKEIREHIFDPFFTTKDVGKGTGLGLSTVYGAVKQHNGYITVYSEPGMGTAFHIYFPVVSAEIADQTDKSSPIVAGGNETILVAEDNDSVRDLMKTILTQAGYAVIEATDGEDAVQKYRSHDRIDLVILDSVMPGKNGREACDEIRTNNPEVKVLFTSGYTRDIVLDKGIEEKEVAFISKPLTPSNLLKKVREVLHTHE